MCVCVLCGCARGKKSKKNNTWTVTRHEETVCRVLSGASIIRCRLMTAIVTDHSAFAGDRGTETWKRGDFPAVSCDIRLTTDGNDLRRGYRSQCSAINRFLVADRYRTTDPTVYGTACRSRDYGVWDFDPRDAFRSLRTCCSSTSNSSTVLDRQWTKTSRTAWNGLREIWPGSGKPFCQNYLIHVLKPV